MAANIPWRMVYARNEVRNERTLVKRMSICLRLRTDRQRSTRYGVPCVLSCLFWQLELKPYKRPRLPPVESSRPHYRHQPRALRTPPSTIKSPLQGQISQTWQTVISFQTPSSRVIMTWSSRISTLPTGPTMALLRESAFDDLSLISCRN